MGGTSLAQLVAKQRGRTRESPHLWFSRVFYEASRDLGSQPTPRNRPRRSLSSPGCSDTPILVGGVIVPKGWSRPPGSDLRFSGAIGETSALRILRGTDT